MSRRPGNPARRFANSGSVPFASVIHQKTHSSPLLSVGLVIVGGLLLFVYSSSGSGGPGGDQNAVSKIEG